MIDFSAWVYHISFIDLLYLPSDIIFLPLIGPLVWFTERQQPDSTNQMGAFHYGFIDNYLSTWLLTINEICGDMTMNNERYPSSLWYSLMSGSLLAKSEMVQTGEHIGYK